MIALKILTLLALFFSISVSCQSWAAAIPDELKNIGITNHAGQNVSINELTFRDEQGQQVQLKKFFSGKKPVLLTLVYYECPNLCNFLLNGLLEGLRPLKWTIGDKFEIVTVSIDARETPALAARKKEAYLRAYGRPEGAEGWHFLTGTENQIKKLASEVGFGYRYDEKEKQFAHSAGIFALTPEGRISQTLYGITFKEQDLRLALLEASNGKIGTVVDQILLFCYRYDEKTRKYSVYLTRVMQAGSASTVLVFGGFLAVFWRRQRRDKGFIA